MGGCALVSYKRKREGKPNEANRQRAEDSNSDLVTEDLGSETDKLCSEIRKDRKIASDYEQDQVNKESNREELCKSYIVEMPSEEEVEDLHEGVVPFSLTEALRKLSIER